MSCGIHPQKCLCTHSLSHNMEELNGLLEEKCRKYMSHQTREKNKSFGDVYRGTDETVPAFGISI